MTKSNIQERSELILEQWGKTGSLFPHNVVLVPLGDDFTYSNDAEWDQQYSGYNQIMDYINSNSNYYNAQIQWGTLTDYFNAVHGRMTKFDDLVGDFFVYSDVFSEGKLSVYNTILIFPQAPTTDYLIYKGVFIILQCIWFM